MATVAFSEAKARLSEIFDRVEAGEEITVLRRGKPVAKISQLTSHIQPPDFDAILEEVQSMPVHIEDAGVFMRRMRDGDRY